MNEISWGECDAMRRDAMRCGGRKWQIGKEYRR